MCGILILADIRPIGYKVSCCGSLWSRKEYKKIRKRHKAHNRHKRHYRSYKRHNKHNGHNRIYKICNVESRMFPRKPYTLNYTWGQQTVNIFATTYVLV